MALATKPKKTPATKKRQAQHHRHSKHYLKAYWPYLPMLVVAILCFYVNTLIQTSAVLGTNQNFSNETLLNDTNAYRQKERMPALTIDPQLSAAAQAKAFDLVQKNYWSHTAPDGKTPWSFITTAGYQYQLAGENLAYGFASGDEALAGWMNSPGHRANILNANYENVGFGVAQAPNYLGRGPQTIIVAEYGTPVAAVANIRFTVANPTPAEVKGVTTELPAQPVSRVQLISNGQADWSVIAVSVLAAAAFTFILIRHSLRLHRLVSRGEAFVAHHPYVDIGAVLVIAVGILLTRTSGFIR